MIVQIDDDFADVIVVASLADSYASMKQSLKNGSLWHEDDVAAYKEMLPALKTVGAWFSIDFDAEIKKAKKRLK
jgi:hypothetical protein